jgi:hypothetical protein
MKFTSIKQIPKEAIEMIDEVQWWYVNYVTAPETVIKLDERLSSSDLLIMINKLLPDGSINHLDYLGFFYIEPRELEDKSYGINLYKKIHGIKD